MLEVKKALKKTKIRNALKSYGILIKVWKCMRSDNLSWLTKIFNKIIKILKKCQMSGNKILWFSSTRTRVFKIAPITMRSSL